METLTVPQGNTQLVATHERDYKQRGYRNCATPEQVQIEGMEGRLNTDVNGAEGRLVSNVNGAEGRLVTNDNGIEGRNLTSAQGLETRLNVDGRIDSFRNSTDRGFDKTQDDVEKFGFANLDTTDKFGWRNLDATDKEGWRNQVETRFYGHQNFNATKDALKDLLIQGCENTYKIASKQDEHYAAIQLEAAKNAGEAKAQLIETKYQLELEAQKTAALLAAQVAECCCENKALIIEKANGTDDLIRKLDEQRVRDELAKTREELIALRVRATLLPPLTGTIPL